MTRRAIARLLALAVVAAVIAALCVPAQAQARRRTLRYEELDWPWGYDPVTAKSNAQKRIAQLLFSGITREVGKDRYKADLDQPTKDCPMPAGMPPGIPLFAAGVIYTTRNRFGSVTDAIKFVTR